MNESISRAAGTEHGQEFPPEAMEDLIRSLGRDAGAADHALRPRPGGTAGGVAGRRALAPVVLTPPRKLVAAE